MSKKLDMWPCEFCREATAGVYKTHKVCERCKNIIRAILRGKERRKEKND